MANDWNYSRRPSKGCPGGLPLAIGWFEGKPGLTDMEAAAKALDRASIACGAEP